MQVVLFIKWTVGLWQEFCLADWSYKKRIVDIRVINRNRPPCEQIEHKFYALGNSVFHWETMGIFWIFSAAMASFRAELLLANFPEWEYLLLTLLVYHFL